MDEITKAVFEKLLEDPEVARKAESIKKYIITPEIEELAKLAHDLFCTEDHGSECQWYEESQLSTCWEEVYHKDWLAMVRDFIDETPNLGHLERLRRLREVSRHNEFAKTLRQSELVMMGSLY